MLTSVEHAEFVSMRMLLVQQDSRKEHGSGLDQDCSEFCPDQGWIGLQFFSTLVDRTGSE